MRHFDCHKLIETTTPIILRSNGTNTLSFCVCSLLFDLANDKLRQFHTWIFSSRSKWDLVKSQKSPIQLGWLKSTFKSHFFLVQSITLMVIFSILIKYLSFTITFCSVPLQLRECTKAIVRKIFGFYTFWIDDKRYVIRWYGRYHNPLENSITYTRWSLFHFPLGTFLSRHRRISISNGANTQNNMQQYRITRT